MELNTEIKIYFAGAVRGDRIAALAMRELIQWLKREKHIVLTEHIAAEDINDKLLAVEVIEKRDIDWIDQATHIIAEISGASTGTGREIEYARVKEKFGKVPARILCLYHIDCEFSASPMIRGMSNDRYPNVFVKSYGNIVEAKNLIENFLKKSN